LFLAHAPASVFGTHSSKLLLAHLSTPQQSNTAAAAAAAAAAAGTGQVPSLSLVPAGYEEVVKVKHSLVGSAAAHIPPYPQQQALAFTCTNLPAV